ncbi:hypothetical protein D3C72_745170 [compost metagenome]
MGGVVGEVDGLIQSDGELPPRVRELLKSDVKTSGHRGTGFLLPTFQFRMFRAAHKLI